MITHTNGTDREFEIERMDGNGDLWRYDDFGWEFLEFFDTVAEAEKWVKETDPTQWYRLYCFEEFAAVWEGARFVDPSLPQINPQSAQSL